MINRAYFLQCLRKLVIDRRTFYNNNFPFNCGYIHENGVLSFDCIGLVKGMINYTEIVDKWSPVGFYIQPGTAIPDYNEIQLLNHCTEKIWNNFSYIEPAEYLYMEGHGGFYVGELFGKNSNVNVIECTTAWGVNGVVASWIDSDGTRRDMKNGTSCGKWEAHGKFGQYIDFNSPAFPVNPVRKSNEEIAKEVIEGKWGVYPLRKYELEKAGYDYNTVQKIVNDMCKTAKKSNEEIAKEVIAGKWDVYPKRKELLEQAGYNYDEVQSIVNKLMS